MGSTIMQGRMQLMISRMLATAQLQGQCWTSSMWATLIHHRFPARPRPHTRLPSLPRRIRTNHQVSSSSSFSSWFPSLSWAWLSVFVSTPNHQPKKIVHSISWINSTESRMFQLLWCLRTHYVFHFLYSSRNFTLFSFLGIFLLYS